MLYGNQVKQSLEEVRLVIPEYLFEISDVNEALDQTNAAGNCAVVSYLGLLVLEDKLGDVPGFSTQFGFNPHVVKPNGKVNVGHALGRFEIGGSPFIFNQSRDGAIRIGSPEEFEIHPAIEYYPTEEVYRNFLESIYGIWSEEAPEFDREDVLRRYKRTLEEKSKALVGSR